MTLQFKMRHYNGILLRDLTSVCSFTIGTFVLASVSANVYTYIGKHRRKVLLTSNIKRISFYR